jgi:large subunit ribosomal protein L4
MATTTSATKSTATSPKLPKEIFGLTVENHQLLKDVYTAYLANGRDNLAKTLKRGEVSGGGKKPWRQKGTGNARTGSIRNPIWRGGGITFGPSGEENYSKKVNAKAKKLALKQALSLAAADKRVLLTDDFIVKDGKTKSAVKELNKLNLNSRVTLVVDVLSDETKRSIANLPEVNFVLVSALSVYDCLNANTLVFTASAVKSLEERLGGKK